MLFVSRGNVERVALKNLLFPFLPARTVIRRQSTWCNALHRYTFETKSSIPLFSLVKYSDVWYVFDITVNFLVILLFKILCLQKYKSVILNHELEILGKCWIKLFYRIFFNRFLAEYFKFFQHAWVHFVRKWSKCLRSSYISWPLLLLYVGEQAVSGAQKASSSPIYLKWELLLPWVSASHPKYDIPKNREGTGEYLRVKLS